MEKPIVKRREQYSFKTDQNTLVDIFQQFAVNSPKVNIVAVVSKYKNPCVSVILVVGPDENDSPVINKIAENIFDNYNIFYAKNTILDVLNIQVITDTPGAYLAFYKPLVQNGIKVLNSYLGEAAAGQVLSAFFDVGACSLNEAEKILEKVS
ncbi:MAG: hypothetical protein Harvfovirus4_26 [Harvfovirus sp.]|uniref:ACT domain-containing protein n=1 Tax=Harvfovirus sp. TaxID=2487768 RepID=A0A3G5A0H8_9VIRU|nr:MAG: hypothetical protein Harvfovirus4_26 [Harvfovirus sp.]